MDEDTGGLDAGAQPFATLHLALPSLSSGNGKNGDGGPVPTVAVVETACAALRVLTLGFMPRSS